MRSGFLRRYGAATGLLLAVFLIVRGGSAQGPPVQLIPAPDPRLQPIFGEHADGGELPVLLGGVSLLGLTIYDVATAPAAARAYNRRHPERPRKSPATALTLSAAATALPIGVGWVVVDRSMADAGGVQAIGASMMMMGIAAGPGAGHWYAGRRIPAIRSSAIRGVLLLGTLYLENCCT